MSLAEGEQAARALLAWFAEDRAPADDKFIVGFVAGEEQSQAGIARLVAAATEVQETNRQMQRTYRDGRYDHEGARLHLLASEAHAAAHHHLTDALGDLAAPAQEGKLSPTDLAELTHVVSDQEIWEDHQAAFQPIDLPARAQEEGKP